MSAGFFCVRCCSFFKEKEYKTKAKDRCAHSQQSPVKQGIGSFVSLKKKKKRRLLTNKRKKSDRRMETLPGRLYDLHSKSGQGRTARKKRIRNPTAKFLLLERKRICTPPTQETHQQQ